MSSQKIQFQNRDGKMLSAKLELPDFTLAHNFVIFAHCFTCNKNLNAVRNISRALNDKGFGVLRFDFTGLGESEGDFSETNFSTNVNDLIDAADYLTKDNMVPTVLVGHSLGGAAVLLASSKIKSIKAVATIGAPSDPEHVSNLLKGGIDQIESTGKASINIGGRSFEIQKQFIDDLKANNLNEILPKLPTSILVCHSPQDKIVEIENARKIYSIARHPKSFISLDGADHLLSKKEDSEYVGLVIAGWASRYVDIPKEEKIQSKHQVAGRLNFDNKFTTHIKAGRHDLKADEPEEVGGYDFGPSPYDLVSSGLAACTVMTLKMYSERKKWPLEEVTVHIDHGKEHLEEFDNLDSKSARIDHFKRKIEFKGELSQEQKIRLLEIADKCPVHKTLHGSSVIKTEFKDN